MKRLVRRHISVILGWLMGLLLLTTATSIHLEWPEWITRALIASSGVALVAYVVATVRSW